MLRAHRNVLGPYLDYPTLWHRLVGIDNQVLNDLTHLSLIGVNCPEIRGRREPAPHIGAPQDEGGRVPDQLDNGSGLLDRRSAPGKGEKLSG